MAGWPAELRDTRWHRLWRDVWNVEVGIPRHLAWEEMRRRAGLTKRLDVCIPVSTLDIPASREPSQT